MIMSANWSGEAGQAPVDLAGLSGRYESPHAVAYGSAVQAVEGL